MPPPVRTNGPPAKWPHRDLYDRVRNALHALPARFRTSLRVAGISAVDLFTLNTPLGAAIEQSVVDSLNELREIWDPTGTYKLYSFVRQAQVFPDVRLETTAQGVPAEDRILLGIELKGWFVLAKEGEPSFRYCVAPAACAAQDLLVVFPWTLDEVVSGSPKLLRPFVEEARFAAEHRNHYWTELRGVKGSAAAVTPAPHQAPYPTKAQKFNDNAVNDSGGNFGRVARGGLMSDFIEELLAMPISGIPAKHWQAFIKIFAGGAQDDAIEKGLKQIRKKAEEQGLPADAIERVERFLRAVEDIYRSPPN
jgi:hypothetical protein